MLLSFAAFPPTLKSRWLHFQPFQMSVPYHTSNAIHDSCIPRLYSCFKLATSQPTGQSGMIVRKAGLHHWCPICVAVISECVVCLSVCLSASWYQGNEFPKELNKKYVFVFSTSTKDNTCVNYLLHYNLGFLLIQNELRKERKKYLLPLCS